MPPIRDSFPRLYHPLLPVFFEEVVPVESKATCASCAMCEPALAVESIDGTSRTFRADTKCCTYHPRLPNYLVGAILSDPAMAEGRRRVLEKIEKRAGVTPQWLKPPAKFTLLYENGRRAFGRTQSLLCPYYDQGACTIWAHREAVCSTYFCRHVAGADGRAFWMQLKHHLTLAEVQLSRLALLELLPDFLLEGRDRAETPVRLTPEDLDDRPPPEAEHARLWGRWAGREEDFYLACHELVRGLSREQLERALGLDGTISQAVLERLHRAITEPVLPPVLKLNPEATIKHLPDGSIALGAYSEHDAVALPGAAYPLLVRFRGDAPVASVRGKLRSELGADLDDEVLLALHQLRVLIAP